MIRKILVPVDGSDQAGKAIEYASDIALKYKAIVYLVHVVTPLPCMVDEPDMLQDLKDKGEEFAEEILREATREVKTKGLRNFQSSVLHGSPAEAILDYAKRNDVDMIVMGSRGMGGVKGLFLGSVSNKVCHMAECTCVTVK